MVPISFFLPMKRIPEPELMDEAEQAYAYAHADFEEPHNHFIDLLKSACGHDLPATGRALDLGCGAADISIRFARSFPGYIVDAVDGAEAMLNEAEKILLGMDDLFQERIHLVQGHLQDFSITDYYEIIFSNSLLHHLHDPMVLWNVLQKASPDTQIFIMDLMRPDSETAVDELVQLYAAGEPEILQRDFRNSLFAAFTPGEVELQLQEAGLKQLVVEVVSDRHLVVLNK